MARPLPEFNGFVGQTRAVEVLKRQIEGAKKLAEPAPHTLFLGPSGVGKTCLARAAAAALETKLWTASGYDALDEIAATVRQVNVGDVLFVDESHNLSPKIQEMLYSVIDQRRLPDWAVKGIAVPDGGLEDVHVVKPFTLILATDRASELLNATRKRFALTLTLQYYSVRELKEIVDVMAADRILLSSQASNRIAQISRGLPRIARHHLEKLRFHFPDSGQTQIGLPELQGYMDHFGIFGNGLAGLDREYLKNLASFGTASIETLAGSIGQERDWVRQEIEANLHRLRFINIGPRGRELTATGSEWLQTSTPKIERNNNHDHDCSGQTAN